jgi:hypothetical protein
MSRRLAYLSDDARALGINIVAAKGTGKSRLIGRFLLPQHAYGNIPTILIDPIGETINNFLSKLTELPQSYQEKIWQRVVLLDLAGRGGNVPGLPLYYGLGDESLYRIAQRPLEIIRKADAFLMQAPVHGWNPTWFIGTHAGRILYACGYQISELENLLTFPDTWESRFQKAEKIYPEVAQSTTFFRNEYSKWSKDRRISRTEALRIKAATFTLDPETLAMFSAPKPTLDIAEVIDKGQIVLIDVSGVTDIERRRFILMWLISYIMSFIKVRGPGHHHKPLSLVIDEFSLLTNFQSSADDSFSQELDELINVYSRSHRLWLTIASQSIGQFTEGTQRALLSLGTQIFGAIPDMESALKIAKWFASLDPRAVKHNHPIYFATQDTEHGIPTGPRNTFYPRVPEIIGYRPEFMELSSQEYVEAKRLRELEKFHFLVRPALAEGTVATTLYPVTIERFDKNIWVDTQLVEQAKTILRKRAGLPVGQLLKEIAGRLPTPSRAMLESHEDKWPSLPAKDSDKEDY